MARITGIGSLTTCWHNCCNSQVDLKLFRYGDLWTDWHHSAEDVGIVVGMFTAAVCSKANATGLLAFRFQWMVF